MIYSVIALCLISVICMAGWFRRFVDTYTLVIFLKEKGIEAKPEELEECRKKALASLPSYLFK